ncbi:hypothetical protein IIY66_01285 [Candidatus Saccharibacteria bacterium]|nr:hypothetical protein [Candidatus Saccharibacteria bacterium]
MIVRKESKKHFKKAVFGCFFTILGILSGIVASSLYPTAVFADPNATDAAGEISVPATPDDNVAPDNGTAPANDTTNTSNPNETTPDGPTPGNTDESQPEEGTTTNTNETPQPTSITGDRCQDGLGSMGWLVCPATKKISEAVNWLYEKLEDILVINPVSMEEGSPIYQIWQYFLGVTNILFIIFLLVVVYSQLTGVGISNYGIKKVLPKLIVTAVLVNLSFLICVIAVDVSNIMGNSLRGVFTGIEDSVSAGLIETSSSTTTATGDLTREAKLGYTDMYGSLMGTAGITIGGAIIAFETGAIWMLIPVVLGAIVAVVSGLITISLRQAVVMLLIMVSPLAIIAYMLPNTDQWFKKWRQLFIKMLVFYPAFSLLFGASSLAGFAIMASAKDSFGVLLGIAVQIFPLFFSWSLMKMSGTFLGTINAKMHSLAARPLSANRSWAESRRLDAKQRHLASGRPTTSSLQLMQFMTNRRIAREAEIAENSELIKNRALARNAAKHYDSQGRPTREGERAYEAQAKNMEYQQIIMRDRNNMNKGLGQLAAVQNYSSVAQKARLKMLDNANVLAADSLKAEQARGAKIEYDNAKGFQERINNAMNAHFDQSAINAGNIKYQLHGVLSNSDNMARYEKLKDIMEGNEKDVHFVAADAAYAFDSQAQIVRSRFQKYMDLTAPTQDVVNRLRELTSSRDSSKYIDPIIAGLRTLNMRGDTDLVRKQLHEVMKDGKVELGSYTSQSLASFLMFDVKDSDPFLRRFGKYINMETAKMYNEAVPGDRRTRKDVSFYEYVNGEYVDRDASGRIIYEGDSPKIVKVKRDAIELLKGTSFKGMERTAISNMIQSVREYSVDIDKNGNTTFSYEKFKENEKAIWNAIMPNIIGDQFSFLSGSEQIIGLGKGITGVDIKSHSIDWKGIFGDYAKSLTPEQKADYAKILNQRTKTFLGGHVPVQIAKTKTDMLEVVKTQYALWDEINKFVEFDEKGNVVKMNNPDALNLSFKGDQDGYTQFEKDRFEGIQKEFIGSFKKDALEGFGKMYRKGYQGEAKDGLIRLLKPVLDQQAATVARSERNDEEDGRPVQDTTGAEGLDAGSVYNNARMAVEQAYQRYRNSYGQDNVRAFWDEIESDILSSTDAQTGELTAMIDRLKESLSQFTNVDELYRYIMKNIFND